MLTNPAYKGVLRVGHDARSRAKFVGYGDDKVWIECAFPAIVDQATYSRAQDALEAASHTKRRRYEHLLPGIVFCGECGKRMYGQTLVRETLQGTKSSRQYICASSNLITRQCEARAHVLCDRLERLVLRLISDFVLSEENRSRVIDAAKQETAAGDVAKPEQRQLQEVENKIEAAKRNLAFADTKEVQQAIAEVYRDLLTEAERLRKAIASAVDRVVSRSDFIAAIDHLDKHRERLDSADPAKLRIAIGKTVERITIWKRGLNSITLTGEVKFREDAYVGAPITLSHDDIGQPALWRKYAQYAKTLAGRRHTANYAKSSAKGTSGPIKFSKTPLDAARSPAVSKAGYRQSRCDEGRISSTRIYMTSPVFTTNVHFQRVYWETSAELFGRRDFLRGLRRVFSSNCCLKNSFALLS